MEILCPFCEVAAMQPPANVVAESPLALAILDLHPVADGHCLVIPRRHVATLASLRAEEGAEMFALATRVSRVVRQTLAPAVNLHLSDGSEAEQDIPHVHLHVIPRHRDDDVAIHLPPTPNPKDLESTATALRTEMRTRSI